MKNLTPLLLLTFIMVSCNEPSKNDLLIIDYVSSINENTKIDLKVKILSSKELGNITGEDSLNYFLSEFTNDWGNPEITIEEYLQKRNGNLEVLNSALTNWQNKIDSVKASEDQYLLETLLKGQAGFLKQKEQIDNELNIINSYKANQKKVLGKKVESTYSIVNPLMNNAVQEITNTFIFSPDYSKIKGTIK